MNTKNSIKVVILLIFVIIIAFFVPSRKEQARENFISGYVAESSQEEKDLYEQSRILIISNNYSWRPKEETGTSTQPEINGIAGFVVDINSGEVFFEKNSAKKLKIASLVKIMTAVVALEHKNLGSKIYVSQKAASIGENSMGLSMGESYTLEQLLYGLMLSSGNDAAYAIAEGVAGSSDRFVDWMNFKAQDIGLKDTKFYDPSGLDDRTYSTPQDLAILTKYAMKNENFKKIVATVETEIPYSKTNKFIPLYNQTNLLTTYPGVAGVKTGYTEEAGLCLVTYAKNQGVELVGIVLNSSDRKGDMIQMLDHSFSTKGVFVEHNLLD